MSDLLPFDVGKKIVDAAESWIGTPYKWLACSKGKGVDCARFVVAVMKEAGKINQAYQPPVEHADWIYGKNIDKDAFVRELKKYCHEVKYDDRFPGDILIFKYNGIQSHIGVLVYGDFLIHAVTRQAVIKTSMRFMRNVTGVYRIN